MSNNSHTHATPPARTHAEAAALFRRPFAPGAIGFRAMTKVPYNGQPYAGAQVAAYIGAQSVIQRLNAVVPGRWRQQFQTLPTEFTPAGSRRVYLACRLIVTLPVEEGGPDVEAVYEDLGEMDSGSLAGVKALYSDARKRAAVAAGIGAYLYTSLEAVVLPIGPNARQVQTIRRQGKSDLLVLSPDTEQWLRRGYQTRMSTDAVRRDLGEILAHGEPENGIGQGEVADQAAQPTSEPSRTRAHDAGEQRARRGRDRRLRRPRTGGRVMATEQLPAPQVGAAVAIPGAAQLAARIQIPRRLPPRYDGQPLAAPLALELQPLHPLPGGLAPALHPRREDRANRVDVPRPPGRRRDQRLLPAPPRPRRAPHARPGQGRLLGRLEGRSRGRARAARDRVGGRPARGERIQAGARRDRPELRRADPAARRAGRRAAQRSSTARARA